MSAPHLNTLILEIYRASREVPFRHFQEQTLELLKPLIPFDSAWWGITGDTPLVIHRQHLYNCDPGIVDDYLPFLGQDFFRAALIASPGTSINMADLISRDRYVRTPLYRELGRRHRVEWSLGTLLIEPVSSLFEFITLWRHDPKYPFNEEERQTKEWLMPHIAEAHRNARLLHLWGEAEEHKGAWALADDHAYLLETSPTFLVRLRDEWPTWSDSQLPDELIPLVQAAHPYQGRTLILEISPLDDLRFIQVRSLSAIDRLSPRERDVALRYVRGETHVVIALALGLSPATVRNHIARCFKKLNVNNKSELAQRLERLQRRHT